MLRHALNHYFLLFPISCLLKSLDDPYYCGLKARVPNFAKPNGSINNSNGSGSNNKSVNGTISEKKSSFFGSKKDSKSKDKDKEKDKEKEKDKDKDKEKEKDVKEKESVSPKQRPSIAQMPHPASFSTLYQLHQMQNGMPNGTIKHNAAFHRHFSHPDPYMWHAKSYESGIGKWCACSQCSRGEWTSTWGLI